MFQTIDFSFTSIDILNNAFTYIATAYIYLAAIAIALLFVQYVLDRRDHQCAVSDELNRGMADPQTKVLLSIEPTEPVAPQGKVLKLTVEKPKDNWLNIDFSSLSIRAIRAYVRDNSLQDLIKDTVGKSVSRCTLNELRKALIESQESDRVYRIRA